LFVWVVVERAGTARIRSTPFAMTQYAFASPRIIWYSVKRPSPTSSSRATSSLKSLPEWIDLLRRRARIRLCDRGAKLSTPLAARDLCRDFLLAMLTIYWVTETATSSARLYYDHRRY
jgi:hypothetical protein